MFKIEKGIPMPSGVKGNPVYPWHSMEPGDSFVVETAAERSRAVKMSLDYARTHDGVRFMSRVQPDGKYRIWRVL